MDAVVAELNFAWPNKVCLLKVKMGFARLIVLIYLSKHSFIFIVVTLRDRCAGVPGRLSDCMVCGVGPITILFEH